MKRLLIRTAALATVVGLGLIAIAQAQRLTEGSPAADGNSTPPKTAPNKNAVVVPAPAQVFPPREIPKAAAADAQPLAGSSLDFRSRNPLRGPARQVSGTEKAPVSKAPVSKAPASKAPVSKARAAKTHAARALPGRRPGLATADGQLALPNPPGAGRSPAPARVMPAAGSPGVMASGPRPSGGPFSDRMGAIPPGMGALPPQAQPQGNPFPRPASVPPLGVGAASDRSPSAGGHSVPPSAVSPGEGTGQPGSRLLEGPQSPHITVQKFAPEQVQVGKPAKFRLTVGNTGPVAAAAVEVRDQVPKGTRLLGTTPRATRGARGELVWALGTVKPGDEVEVEMELLPTDEGEIGSVAAVTFQTDASARTFATKPELVLKTSMPKQVLIGESVTMTVEVSNPGSGTATGVVLQEHVPAGLQHPAGNDLEYEIGELPPGESRSLQLTMVASRAGPLTNVLMASGEGLLKTEDRVNLEVIAPLLDVAMAGPSKRYLEREAVYDLSVTNPGTAPARAVELVAYLPSGLKFVSANNAGHYEEADRAVHWKLEELPVNETGTVQVVTMPVEAGQQKIRLHGTADKGLSAEDQQDVVIEGIAAIKFQLVDVTDPIEVGGETTYEIRVVNQGSKATTNVRLAVLLPPEMQAIAAEGPTRHAIQGSRVLFDGLSRLAPKADTTYRVRVKGLQPGDLRLKVQLMTDDMHSPVTKEESTRVYSDQ